MFNRFILFRCAVSLFIISLPLYAEETAIPQQLLDWQKTGQELMSQGDISQAFEYYQKIIQYNQDASQTLSIRKAMITMPRDLFSLGKQFENKAQYDTALELYLASIDWPVSGDKSQGIWNDPAFYQMCAQAGVAAVCIHNKNFTAAGTACDTLMTQYTDQPTLAKEIHLVAEMYAKAGQRERAFELYQANVQRAGKAEASFKPGSIWEDPQFFRMRSHEEMAYYYLDQESPDEALSISLEMLNRYPSQLLVVKEAGYILSRLIRENKSDKALTLCGAILSKFPGNPNIIWITGSRVLIDIKNNSMESADTRLKAMQKNYKNHSEYADVIAWMGLECCYAGQYAKAIELSEYTLDLNPSRPIQLYCLMTLARANVNLENDTKVQEYIKTILSNYTNPEDNSAGYLSAIGEEYYLAGQKTDKEEKFNKSVDLLGNISLVNPNKQVVAEIHYLLGLNYRSLGQYMKAATSLEAAYSADSEYMQAEYCLFAAGDSYEKSLKQNLVLQTEGKAAIRRIYTQFIQNYPDSKYVSHAGEWLDNNPDNVGI